MYDVIYVGWDDGTSLYHYGIAGQKWGNRRFQNQDGSLTAEGRARYGVGERIYGKGRFGNNGYVSRSTKNADKGSAAYKANKAYDKKIEDYYNKASVGKNVVKDLLLGTSGAMTYNMARAAGESRGKAWLRTVFDINLGSLAGATVGSGLQKTIAAKGAMKGINRLMGDDNADVMDMLGDMAKGNAKGLAAGVVASKATQRAIRNTGSELSLQQRALRRKATRKGY